MSEVILPIPDDIRHLVLLIWGVRDYDSAMSSPQVLLDSRSIREAVAAGGTDRVRAVLRQLSDGAYT